MRLDFWMLYGKRSSTLNAAKYYIFDRGIMERLSTLNTVKDQIRGILDALWKRSRILNTVHKILDFWML